LAQRCFIDSVSIETVRFDTQKMENPEVSGVVYLQGELHGYEVREYLLEKLCITLDLLVLTYKKASLDGWLFSLDSVAMLQCVWH